MEYKDFWNFEILNLHFCRFFLKLLGPKRFKKLRQACRKNFHLVAPLKDGVVTSYDRWQFGIGILIKRAMS